MAGAWKAAVIVAGIAIGIGWLTLAEAAVPNPKTRPTSSPAPKVSEADFLAVTKASCVRCHRTQCQSVESLKAARWLIPGKPEQSKILTVIGVHKKRGGTYHNLAPKDAKTLYDFVKAMPQ